MDYEKAKHALAEAFAAAQQLDIQPTKKNVDILGLIYSRMDDAFEIIDRAQAEEKKEET